MHVLKFLSVFLFAHICSASTSSVQVVNKSCPYSNKIIDAEQVLSYGVCCSNCVKKASSNLLEFIKKAKPNNRTCSFSAKPVRKIFSVGFCCSKCKKKASGQKILRLDLIKLSKTSLKGSQVGLFLSFYFDHYFSCLEETI